MIPYDRAVDVWSLGATLLQVGTGRLLFVKDAFGKYPMKSIKDQLKAFTDEKIVKLLKGFKKEMYQNMAAVLIDKYKQVISQKFNEKFLQLERDRSDGLIRPEEYKHRSNEMAQSLRMEVGSFDRKFPYQVKRDLDKLKKGTDDFFVFIKKLLTVDPRQRKREFSQILGDNFLVAAAEAKRKLKSGAFSL